MIKEEDFKLEYEIKEKDKDKDVIFLPYLEDCNFKNEKKIAYYDSTLNLMKLFKQQNISSSLGIGTINDCVFADNHSADWFGPTLFISTVLISQNPQLISILLSIIANYVYDLFKGKNKDPNVKFSVVLEKKDGTKKIRYEGPVSGVKEIEKIVNGK